MSPSASGWVAGGIAFVLVLVLLPFSGGQCEDGWKSSSIGRQGACSHHGGVDRNEGWLILAAAVASVVGFGVSSWRQSVQDGRDESRLRSIAAKSGIRASTVGEATRLKSSAPSAVLEAIENGKLLEFVYRKAAGKSEVRKIRPETIAEVAHTQGHRGGASLCVRGYCFDRREDRTFAIRKMSDIVVVEE